MFLFLPDCHELHLTLVNGSPRVIQTVTNFTNTGKCFSLCHPDCHELYQTGRRTSGVYYIQPNAAPYQLPVYCLMMNGTGHTVIQRRLDGLLNFNRYRQLPVWKRTAINYAWRRSGQFREFGKIKT